MTPFDLRLVDRARLRRIAKAASNRHSGAATVQARRKTNASCWSCTRSRRRPAQQHQHRPVVGHPEGGRHRGGSEQPHLQLAARACTGRRGTAQSPQCHPVQRLRSRSNYEAARALFMGSQALVEAYGSPGTKPAGTTGTRRRATTATRSSSRRPSIWGTKKVTFTMGDSGRGTSA